MRYTITLTYDSDDEDSPRQAVESMREWMMQRIPEVRVVDEMGQDFGDYPLWGDGA